MDKLKENDNTRHKLKKNDMTMDKRKKNAARPPPNGGVASSCAVKTSSGVGAFVARIFLPP